MSNKGKHFIFNLKNCARITFKRSIGHFSIYMNTVNYCNNKTRLEDTTFKVDKTRQKMQKSLFKKCSFQQFLEHEAVCFTWLENFLSQGCLNTHTKILSIKGHSFTPHSKEAKKIRLIETLYLLFVVYGNEYSYINPHIHICMKTSHRVIIFWLKEYI